MKFLTQIYKIKEPYVTICMHSAQGYHSLPSFPYNFLLTHSLTLFFHLLHSDSLCFKYTKWYLFYSFQWTIKKHTKTYLSGCTIKSCCIHDRTPSNPHTYTNTCMCPEWGNKFQKLIRTFTTRKVYVYMILCIYTLFLIFFVCSHTHTHTLSLDLAFFF